MKKIIAISALALAVAACGGTAAPKPASSATATATQPAASTPAAVVTPTAAATATAARVQAAPSAAAATSSGTSTAGKSLGGTWTVGLGAPTVVSITESGSVYTISTVGPAESLGSDCNLPVGTKIVTFSATGTGTYSGQQGTWGRASSTAACSFTGWAKATLTLSGTQAPYSLVMPSTDPNDPLPITFHQA